MKPVMPSATAVFSRGNGGRMVPGESASMVSLSLTNSRYLSSDDRELVCGCQNIFRRCSFALTPSRAHLLSTFSPSGFLMIYVL